MGIHNVNAREKYVVGPSIKKQNIYKINTYSTNHERTVVNKKLKTSKKLKIIFCFHYSLFYTFLL